MTSPKRPLRSFRFRIADVVRRLAVPHELVLTDYALSYILAGLYGTAQLREALVFKGGTALRKCYFRGYRFYEDLDFTLLRELAPETLQRGLRDALRLATELAQPHGRFEFELQRREQHPFGQLELGVQVAFPTGVVIPIKLEIAGTEEPILLPTRTLGLIHPFEEEELRPDILCYSLEEIAIEKLRAFLQARSDLDRRGWVHRPRDVYDIWYLQAQSDEPIRWGLLLEPLRVKAAARGLSFRGPPDFLDDRVLRAYQAQWEARLGNFARALPDFATASGGLQAVLDEIFPGESPHGEGS